MKAPKITSTGVVVALVAALLVTGVVVAGAHGGGPKRQVIHACVDDATGAIEIVRASDHCGAGESPLDWNGKGRAGPQGPPGLDGEPGVADVTVVTATTTTSTIGAAQNAVIALGAGVDCPGDSVATGGGGSAAWHENSQGEAPAINGVDGAPLAATYPLEKDSTDDPAEPGDEATGWFARAADVYLQPGNWTVTVWAVCADTDQGPPEDEDD